MLVETCNPVVDATPPLVDGDVEQRALDGDQPGVGESLFQTGSQTPPHISGSSRPGGYEILLCLNMA